MRFEIFTFHLQGSEIPKSYNCGERYVPTTVKHRSVSKNAKKIVSFITSVRLHGTTPLPLGRFSWSFVSDFFRKKSMSGKFRLHENLKRITDTLYEDRYTFLIISRSVFLRMRNVSDKSCRENLNTHFKFRNFFSKILPFMK